MFDLIPSLFNNKESEIKMSETSENFEKLLRELKSKSTNNEECYRNLKRV